MLPLSKLLPGSRPVVTALEGGWQRGQHANGPAESAGSLSHGKQKQKGFTSQQEADGRHLVARIMLVGWDNLNASFGSLISDFYLTAKPSPLKYLSGHTDTISLILTLPLKVNL